MLMPMPTYMSVIAPLAGTKTFLGRIDIGRVGPESSPARSRRRDGRLLEPGGRSGGHRRFHRTNIPPAVGGCRPPRNIHQENEARRSIAHFEPYPVVLHCIGQFSLLPVVARRTLRA